MQLIFLFFGTQWQIHDETQIYFGSGRNYSETNIYVLLRKKNVPGNLASPTLKLQWLLSGKEFHRTARQNHK